MTGLEDGRCRACVRWGPEASPAQRRARSRQNQTLALKMRGTWNKQPPICLSVLLCPLLCSPSRLASAVLTKPEPASTLNCPPSITTTSSASVRGPVSVMAFISRFAFAPGYGTHCVIASQKMHLTVLQTVPDVTHLTYGRYLCINQLPQP
ncbi:uncharacterized protein J3D65DRAFT_1069 [Phyllosticta citribraziliensis]|uniref:Uncharacterized protein n=1 Tax=Phyllosticta citribraziliensis TaxID=989973 RepID=A0ABR1M7Y4_9PEZI